MKGTPIFEEVFIQLIRQPHIGLRVLVGGLLSFVPGLNIFAFGYLYRFSRRTRRTGQITLGEWSDWRGLFIDGLRFAVAWLAYWLLPILLALALSTALSRVGLGAVSYLLLSVTFLLSPIIFSSALCRLQLNDDFKDLLDVALIIRMSYLKLFSFIIPALVFVGIFALTVPFYGFAVFFGFLMLIAYTSISYRALEHEHSSAL